MPARAGGARAGAGRSTSLKPGVGGRLASAKSKTGDPQCSAAMSAMQAHRHGKSTVGMAIEVAHKVLGKCRSLALNRKRAEHHRNADREARAQVIEHRVKRGLVTVKERQAEATRLKAERAARLAQKPQGKPARQPLKTQTTGHLLAAKVRKNLPAAQRQDIAARFRAERARTKPTSAVSPPPGAEAVSARPRRTAADVFRTGMGKLYSDPSDWTARTTAAQLARASGIKETSARRIARLLEKRGVTEYDIDANLSPAEARKYMKNPEVSPEGKVILGFRVLKPKKLDEALQHRRTKPPGRVNSLTGEPARQQPPPAPRPAPARTPERAEKARKLAELRKAVLAGGKTPATELVLNRWPNHAKEYAAHLAGPHPQYTFERNFAPVVKRNWSRSGKGGDTTVRIETPGFYEISNPRSGLYGADARQFYKYTKYGRLKKTTRERALEVVAGVRKAAQRISL